MAGSLLGLVLVSVCFILGLSMNLYTLWQYCHCEVLQIVSSLVLHRSSSAVLIATAIAVCRADLLFHTFTAYQRLCSTVAAYLLQWQAVLYVHVINSCFCEQPGDCWTVVYGNGACRPTS